MSADRVARFGNEGRMKEVCKIRKGDLKQDFTTLCLHQC